MRIRAPILAAAFAAVALAAGCGGDGNKTATTPPASEVTVVSATMTGAAAVPKGPRAAAGTAAVTLNPEAGKACWRLSVRGIDRPLSAHVHEAPPGKLGPVVIPLGDRFSARGCVLAPKKALRAVARAPGSYYVDVHSSKHLQGAVRGRLHAR